MERHSNDGVDLGEEYRASLQFNEEGVAVEEGFAQQRGMWQRFGERSKAESSSGDGRAGLLDFCEFASWVRSIVANAGAEMDGLKQHKNDRDCDGQSWLAGRADRDLLAGGASQRSSRQNWR